MYKNIKRKQKMIDQMQNNDINNSDNEEEEEENEEISNTVFSSKVMNSIFNKTLSSLNRSENGENTEQSINNFISQINDIEIKVNQINSNANANANGKNNSRIKKKIIVPIKMNKNFIGNNNNDKVVTRTILVKTRYCLNLLKERISIITRKEIPPFLLAKVAPNASSSVLALP